MNSQPLVSVLMPVYNAEQYLSQSIESVLSQTYPDFEFLIINDGSTDGSEKKILSYTDRRIRFRKNSSNTGLIDALNKGIELATGKYIVRMDADDICLPERIDRQVKFMESNPEIGISGCCADVIDKPDLKMKYDADDASIRVKMLYQCHMLHPSVIIRRELLNKYDLRYNPQFKHAEDYELFYRIGKYTKLANLPDVLLLYREHEASVSRMHKQVQNDNSMKVIKQQFTAIGTDLTEVEINLFAGVMDSRFDFTETELYQIETLLLKIIASNQQSKKLDENTLTRILFQKWKDMLLNITRLGFKVYTLGMKSPLSQFGSFSTTEKIKLFAKALVKY